MAFTSKNNRFSKWKLKAASKIITFCLDREIDNELFLRLCFFFYNLLIWDSYVLEHKDANHHYIPQFLLKKFKIPNTGLIYQYTYQQEPRSVSIEKEAAYIPNLYSFKSKKTKLTSDFLEKQVLAFSLEKHASRILNKILIQDSVDLITLERSILSSFVGFQYCRTPKFLHHTRTVLEYLHLSKRIPLDEMLGRTFYEDAFLKNVYKITPKGLGEFNLQNKLRMTGAENLIMRLAMQTGDHLSTLIYKRGLRMLEVKEPGFFYLSDSPADIYNVGRRRLVGPFLWEMKENPIIYIPISPNRCLYYVETYEDREINPGLIGSILEKALSDSVFEFAFSDRESGRVKSAFRLN